MNTQIFEGAADEINNRRKYIIWNGIWKQMPFGASPHRSWSLFTALALSDGFKGDVHSSNFFKKKNLRKLKTKLDIDGSVSHRHCDCLSFSVVQNDTHRISHRPSIRYEIFMHFKFLDSFFSGLFCSRTTHSLEVWLQLLLLCCQMPGTRALTIHSHSIFYSSAYWPAYTKKQKSQMQMKYILHVVTHSIISVTNFCRSASQARQHAHTCDPQRATLCQPQLTTLCEYSSCRNLPRESVRQARTAQMFIFVSSMSQICVFFPFYFLCKSLNGRGLRKRGISLANHTHARAKKKKKSKH